MLTDQQGTDQHTCSADQFDFQDFSGDSLRKCFVTEYHQAHCSNTVSASSVTWYLELYGLLICYTKVCSKYALEGTDCK